MYARNTEPPEKWSVYAEFTISHPGAGDPENAPVTRTEHSDNNVRMTYSWNSQRNPNESWTSTGNLPSEMSSSETYNFQKGNLLFTSTPPRRPLATTGDRSSGYGSNVASPNSVSSHASIQHQDESRKCRSTCNITLCANPNQTGGAASCQPHLHHHHQCGRTQSLRCQTPSSRSDCKNVYYGCGDPWCHHLRAGDDFATARGFSPVPEEDCGSFSGGVREATRSLSRELNRDLKKDVSVQTFEMVDKCTSPFLKVEGDSSVKNEEKRRKVKRRSASRQRRSGEIYQRSRSPSTFTPDSLESGSKEQSRRLTRSPKLRRIPPLKQDNSDVTTTTTTATEDKSSGSKKPRTVHIDVYCTGTEPESDSSDLSGTETPQTVFESEQVKITHKRADTNVLPKTIQEDSALNLSNKNENDNVSSDSDNASTAYPSKLSSYSTVRDLASSSISSVAPSYWTDFSITDFDSIANTSWKDNTYSDLDSVLQSRSSVANTESLLFVPKKLSESIDETPEMTSSRVSSLRQSDSFEYADSEDKLRIKRMAAMWKKEEERKMRLEKIEARKMEQERKMNEFLKQKRKDLAKKESKESDSDDSADSGKAWTFVKDDSKKLERDTTIRRPSKQDKAEKMEPEKPRRKPSLVDQGSLSDSSPSVPSCRTPSAAMLMQRLSLDPTLRAPFTIAPGLYTEQRNIAKKFGQVVGAFRKPGHHVGPVRNPECACAHCRDYYENSGIFRSRTRSVGDPPSHNWKNI